MTPSQQLLERFRARYGASPPLLVRAPGRVNLIGEHTDYNDGFVLPIAIDRTIWVALRPREDRHVVIRSLDYDATVRFDLDAIAHGGETWGAYAKGVAWALQKAGHELHGWEGLVAGDVPRGAGLSSSAAVELAVARAFAAVAGWAWEPREMALLGQRVENEWIGVNCGIMDQMIVASAQEGAALLIDCRTLEIEPAPLPAGTAVVVLDTGTYRGLVNSAYNERRSQCEEAARFFGVPALRDVDREMFEDRSDELPELPRRRARHVVTENERVLEAVEAMRADDLDRLGALMNASHASLRDDFEVSSEALDVMADLARAQPGCYGARMTGAGFGGCAVALVATEHAGRFTETVDAAYRDLVDAEPSLYVCRAAGGAGLVDLDHSLSSIER